MTFLICSVQRLFLGDEKRTLIKEGERFEVDEKTAAAYVKGGIAKPEKEIPVKTEEIKSEDAAGQNDEKSGNSGKKKR